jgi:hypothetical protein
MITSAIKIELRTKFGHIMCDASQAKLGASYSILVKVKGNLGPCRVSQPNRFLDAIYHIALYRAVFLFGGTRAPAKQAFPKRKILRVKWALTQQKPAGL